MKEQDHLAGPWARNEPTLEPALQAGKTHDFKLQAEIARSAFILVSRQVDPLEEHENFPPAGEFFNSRSAFTRCSDKDHGTGLLPRQPVDHKQ